MNWRALYDRESPAMMSHLLARGCPPELAEDVIHEVFLAAMRARSAPARPRAYLFRAARNALEAHRKRLRRTARLPEVVTTDAACPVDAAPVNAALRRLPLPQREVVVLRIWHGLSFREIGEALGIPTDTAASRWRHGLDRLRNALRETEVQE